MTARMALSALCASILTLSVTAVKTLPAEAASRTVTVPYNPANPEGSPDVPFNHSSMVAPVGCVPQQVSEAETAAARLWAPDRQIKPVQSPRHTTCANPFPLYTHAQVQAIYYSPTSALISWANCNGEIRPTTVQPRAPGALVPEVVVRGAGQPARTFTGTTTAYSYSYVPVGGNVYTSPYLSHVLVTGLKPGETAVV